MIYLVSGLWRSGTSMMMRCLDAGGMEIAYTIEQTNYVALHGYEPTPGGIFETAASEFKRPDFVQAYDGKVVKCPLPTLLELPRHEYKLIFMLRKPKSIRRSMLRHAPTALFPQEDMTWFYEQIFTAIIAELNKRGDFDVWNIQYEDVIDDPYLQLEYPYRRGWPIDYQSAARVVDASLQRNNINGR
jgi:hypothetical protein